jgi:hypothetical protein
MNTEGNLRVDDNKSLISTAQDVLAGQDYYRNMVQAKEKESIYQQHRNQNLTQVIDAARNIAKNENMAIENYERSNYQAAQTVDKSGWSGGYALDSNRQLEYMRASIQADILSQKQLQALGYKTALASAIAATELQADQLALERYRQARQDAEYTSQLTGYYVEPHIADMATQASALQTLIDDENTSDGDREKYENALLTIQKNLNKIVSEKNSALKKIDAGYSFGEIGKDGNVISITGIKTLAQIQREMTERTEKATAALQEYNGEIKKIELSLLESDRYEIYETDENGNKIFTGYGSYKKDKEEALMDLQIEELEIKNKMDRATVLEKTYNPQTGFIIPEFKNGELTSYTNVAPTDPDKIKELKDYFANNEIAFNRFISSTISQFNNDIPDDTDFGTHYAEKFGDVDILGLIKKYTKGDLSDQYSDGHIVIKKLLAEQEIKIGDKEGKIPKDSWVIMDKKGFGYVLPSANNAKGFAFKTKEAGGDETPQPSTSSQAKGVYGTELDKDSKNANYNTAITNDFYASPDGKTHYVTLRGTDSKAAAAVKGQLGYLYIYATKRATEGSPTGAMNAREVQTTVAAGSNDIVIKDKSTGAEIGLGRIAKVGNQFWIRQQTGWSQLGLITDAEEVILRDIAIDAEKVKGSAEVKDARIKGAASHTAGDTTYKVVSKEKGYEVTHNRFNGTNVNYVTITLANGKWVDVRIKDAKDVTNDKQPGELFYKDGTWYISKNKDKAYPVKKHTALAEGFDVNDYHEFLKKIDPTSYTTP